jgi:hypothetical protein
MSLLGSSAGAVGPIDFEFDRSCKLWSEEAAMNTTIAKMKLSAWFSIAALVFGLVGTADADTYSSTHTSGALFSSPFYTTEALDFDLTVAGFDPTTQSVDSALVGLYFADDSRSDSSESAYLYTDDGRETINIANNLVGWFYSVPLADFTDIDDDGITQLRLDLRSGDFYLQSVTLRIDAAVVPEPGTGLLLGLGLMGAAAAFRRDPSAPN